MYVKDSPKRAQDFTNAVEGSGGKNASIDGVDIRNRKRVCQNPPMV